MTSRQFRVYDTMTAFAWSIRKEQRQGNGPLMFSAAVEPWLLNALAARNRSPIDEAIAELVESGWLLLRRTGSRKDNGRTEPNEYEILEHEAYISAHPGTCPPLYFVPDYETAKELGLRRGDKVTKADVPDNFRRKVSRYTTAIIASGMMMRPQDRAFAKAIADMWSTNEGEDVLRASAGAPFRENPERLAPVREIPDRLPGTPVREIPNRSAQGDPGAPFREIREQYLLMQT
jgi:hypothetical protein